MHFEPNALYHIYNRSNETVFYSRENYLFFLKKDERADLSNLPYSRLGFNAQSLSSAY